MSKRPPVPQNPGTVYHGTAANALPGFLKDGPLTRIQRHTRKPAFCTSKSLEEAGRFALRQTPMSDLTATGIILEFDCRNCRKNEFAETRDNIALFNDEQEVAFFKTQGLKLTAIWRYKKFSWEREPKTA